MYQPSDDSFFFSDFLKTYLSGIKNKSKLKYLDMGTGSGILSETALSQKINRQNILAADIDKPSVDFVSRKNFNALKTNLFSKIPTAKKFDLITFNAPYLPEDKYDKQKDTTGGKNGDEATLKFLKQAKEYLAKNGKIFLLISSLTPLKNINKFKPKILAKKKIFFEELLILEIN
jgi:release factor glutamine methyltransferase